MSMYNSDHTCRCLCALVTILIVPSMYINDHTYLCLCNSVMYLFIFMSFGYRIHCIVCTEIQYSQIYMQRNTIYAYTTRMCRMEQQNQQVILSSVK